MKAKFKLKPRDPIYRQQVILLTWAAAAETVARVIIDNDLTEMSSVDGARLILKALGFKN